MVPKKLSLLLAASLLVGGTAFTAGDPTPDDGRESGFVQGTVQLPTRFADTAAGNADGGWPGLVRRVWNCSAASNGVIGWVAEIYPESWNGYFEITDVSDDTGAGDVDVFFYSEFGDCGGQAAPITLGEFQNDGPESGFVPEGATKAVFFTAEGVNLSFTYVDFEPPVVQVAPGADLDRTVRPGTTVVFTNAGDSYLELVSSSLGIDRAGDGRGIPTGESVAVTVPSTAGTYEYTADGATGTITVVDPA